MAIKALPKTGFTVLCGSRFTRLRANYSAVPENRATRGNTVQTQNRLWTDGFVI